MGVLGRITKQESAAISINGHNILKIIRSSSSSSSMNEIAIISNTIHDHKLTGLINDAILNERQNT